VDCLMLRAQFPEDQATGGAYVVLMPFDPSRPRTQPVGGVARRENRRQLTVACNIEASLL
jgi:hypothetical protein